MVSLNSVVLRESIYVSAILLRVPFTLVSGPNIPPMHLCVYTDACSILMLVLPTDIYCSLDELTSVWNGYRKISGIS